MKLTGILPTRGRQKWANEAVALFRAQEWDGEKHLIVIDDNCEPSFPETLVESDCLSYYVMPPFTIGKKHNIGAEIAEDGYLMHIDSDDWSDPCRAQFQRQMLESSGLAVSGFHSLLFFDETTRKAHRLNGPAQQCAFGTTLMYRRDWWVSHRFNERVQLGEDNRFVSVALEAGQLITAPAERLMVARIHPDNTGPKMPQFWEQLELSALPQEFPH